MIVIAVQSHRGLRSSIDRFVANADGEGKDRVFFVTFPGWEGSLFVRHETLRQVYIIQALFHAPRDVDAGVISK